MAIVGVTGSLTGMLANVDRWFPRLHLFWYRVWRGNMPGLLGKKRILVLTTTGRRTGQRRDAILLYVRDRGDYVVVGSNGGSPHDPTWVLNLRSEPAGSVRIGRSVEAVQAREIEDPEDYERVWRLVVAAFKGYDSYKKKTSRHIPLIRLSKVDR